MAYDDYDDDPDDEGPSREDLDELGDDSTSDTLPCPACGYDVYEDADKCPHCGNWVTLRHGGARNASGLWWLLVAAVIAAMLTAWILW
ncbi:MAG: hypothetical protein ACLFUJ_14035 [Phycisphaerae bacterium]